MINYKTLRIPNNYVLVLPDEDFKTYSFNGIETNIVIGTTAERHKDDDIEKDLVETCQATGQHKSVRGRVFKVCDNIIYNGLDFISCRNKFGNDRSSVIQLQDLKDSSMLYDVPIEAKEHEMVYFDYRQHYECYEQGRYIETELGDMLLMRYDCLIMSFVDNEVNSIKPLNGLVIIEKKKIEPELESKSLIIIANSNKSQRQPKVSWGEVVKSGCICKGYLEDLSSSDDRRVLDEGDIIAYKTNTEHLLEWSLHQVMFGGKEVFAIHRKDLLLVIPKKEEVCLN